MTIIVVVVMITIPDSVREWFGIKTGTDHQKFLKVISRNGVS